MTTSRSKPSDRRSRLPDADTVFKTPRLRLEPLQRSHSRHLHEYLQDTRLYRFYAGEPPPSIEALEERFAQLATRRSPDGAQKWLNFAVRRKNGGYVGWIQASLENAVAVIGYDIFPPHWRRGYGKEACAELLRLLRDDHAIRRVVAIVDSENVASVRLLESLGFTCKWMGPSVDLPGRTDYRYELKM